MIDRLGRKPPIEIGSRVEWHRRPREAGEVIRFDGPYAVVRYEGGGEYQVHAEQLTWLPDEDEIEALKASIRAKNLRLLAQSEGPDGVHGRPKRSGGLVPHGRRGVSVR